MPSSLIPHQISTIKTDATGAQLPSKYLVVCSTGTITVPTDGVPVADGDMAHNVAYGVQTAVFSNLDGNTTYNFAIFPYTNSGSNIDYKTSSGYPTTNAQTEDVYALIPHQISTIKTIDARLALIADSYKREMAILKESAERQIQDIKLRLKTETNLTRKARTELNVQMKLIMEKYYRDVQDLQNAYTARDLAAMRETQDIEIALMADGAEKQRTELRVSYERQIEDLTNAIATQRDLTETEIAEMALIPHQISTIKTNPFFFQNRD